LLFNLYQDVIPLFGLNTVTTYLILILVIGVIGSIVAIFVFPRIFCPLFLKIKAKLKPSYKNAFIDKTPKTRSKRKFIIRLIYIFLLELGLLSFILLIIDPDLFLTEDYNSAFYEGLGVPPEYTLNVVFLCSALILPLINGLWSVGWILEDSGLMHYKFKKRPGNELYEIEPVHTYYNGFLKGYAGISSIFFLISIVVAWMKVSEEFRIADIIWTLTIPAFGIFISIPAYILYTKYILNKKFLRGSLKELKILKESEIFKND